MSATNSTSRNSNFKPLFSKPLDTTQCRYYGPWYIVWPTAMSYAAWQNLLKKLGGLKTKPPRLKKRKKPRTRLQKMRIYFQQKWQCETEKQMEELLVSAEKIPTQSQACELCDKPDEFKLELITVLQQFVKRKHIAQHIEGVIPDNRNPELITYSKQSLIMAALCIFLFRMASGNNYDVKSHDNDARYTKTNIARFIDAPEDCVPVIKTIEKFLKTLSESAINDLMVSFFKDLVESKFFKQHPEIMPGEFFCFACDCVHTHTYTHPHHTDKNEHNDCPYCLKRVYNKDTPQEKVNWMHCTLVVSAVFMGGLKIPIFYHPIHAKQVTSGIESASEESHKQECELVALKTVLPKIRQKFVKMKIVLLLDGLYANRPVIRLAKEYRYGYIIVRKEKCFVSLAKDCDGLAKIPNHQKNCVKKERVEEGGNVVEQRYEWFNLIDISEAQDKELTTNVLRFTETKTQGKDVSTYQCEWLFSWRLSEKNCRESAQQGRLRWEEEDMFNTLKNRGFNLKHDFSRDPYSLNIWQGLSLFAFGVFELFRFSEPVKQKRDMPQSTLAEKLQGQLLYQSTHELFSERHMTIRIQFRYNFVIERRANNSRLSPQRLLANTPP